MRLWTTFVFALCLAGCGDSTPKAQNFNSIPDDQIKSGSAYLTPETRALQNDDFENPGFLWVDKGAELFASGTEGGSCASCHRDGLEGVSVTYPKYDAATQKLINLEQRINLCRSKHQMLPELEYESDDLLSLTAYVANQSHGLPMNVALTEEAQENFDRGQSYFYTRRGQFNLSCEQCHVENFGLKLRGDTISQGHSNGFPAYRFEWQTFGSLHRRLHDCDTGVRAEPNDLGSQKYIDLEYFLGVRATGLKSESPAIRR